MNFELENADFMRFSSHFCLKKLMDIAYTHVRGSLIIVRRIL
jgi:hypothetical protein